MQNRYRDDVVSQDPIFHPQNLEVDRQGVDYGGVVIQNGGKGGITGINFQPDNITPNMATNNKKGVTIIESKTHKTDGELGFQNNMGLSTVMKMEPISEAHMTIELEKLNNS